MGCGYTQAQSRRRVKEANQVTMAGLLMPLKDRVRELRKAADLTQQELASRAELSISVVVQIESGKIPDPRLTTLRKLARALGVTLDELAGGVEPEPEAEAEEPPPEPKKPRKGK
jgi:transcriptional regulator with XRE-family HTH domain